MICETSKGRHDVSVRIRNDLDTATRMINPLSPRPARPGSDDDEELVSR